MQALAAKGHAFDHGYAAQRAKRLFKAGLGHTELDDLALALGYPYLAELAPDVDGDVKAQTAARICAWTPGNVPWPRNIAVRAARAIAEGWDEFPDTLSAKQLAVLAIEDDWRVGEEATLLERLQQLRAASWRHSAELMFLCEALSGGEATIRALLDSIEQHPERWADISSLHYGLVMTMGMMLDRLSAEAAAPYRPRMEALLVKPMTVKVTSLPLRALDIVLHGADGYERTVELGEWGRSREAAFFLDRTEWKRLALPAPKPLPWMLPTVQWVVQGGIEELKHVGNPAKYELSGSKKEAHRRVATQFARLAAPEVAGFMKKLTAAPKKV